MPRLTAFAPLAFVLVLLAGCGGDRPVVTLPDTPEGTVRTVVEQLQAGNARVVYDALPASYQKDVTALAHEVGRQMDDEVLTRAFALVDKLARLLQTKKEWLLEGLQALYGTGASDRLASYWDHIEGFVGALAQSRLRTSAAMQSLDLGDFLGTTGSELLGHYKAMSAIMPGDPFAQLAGMSFEPGVSEPGVVSVQMLRNGEKGGRPEEFARVEGRWVFAGMAKEWTEAMADGKKAITGLDLATHKAEVMQGIAGIEKVIDGLLAAKDKEEFKRLQREAMEQMDGLDRMLLGRRR